jgi:hypothetical protein
VPSPQIQIKEARLFTAGAIAIISAYGLVGIIPIFALFLIVSLLGFKISTLLIGLAVIALVILLLPLASGNPHVTRLVRSLPPAGADPSDGLIVQLTFSPRIRTDLRALIEDADDIGYLTTDQAGFRFEGDSVHLSIPFDQVKHIQRKYRGLRSLFVPRVVVVIAGSSNFKALEFSERSSRLLPASRRVSQKLYQMLASRAVLANCGGS